MNRALDISVSSTRILPWVARRPLTESILIVSAVLAAVGGMASAEAPKQRPTVRRYDAGPLTMGDFRRAPPGSTPGRALTMARIRYEFGYQTQRQEDASNRSVQAKLTWLKTFSALDKDASWWNHPNDTGLLDHEQGHFDIAEITARRVQLAFDRMLRSNKTIAASEKDAERAIAALTKKLEHVMEVANQQAAEENKLYDLQTQHGRRPRPQAEHRRIQALTLRRLRAQLAAIGRDGAVEPGRPGSANENDRNRP